MQNNCFSRAITSTPHRLRLVRVFFKYLASLFRFFGDGLINRSKYQYFLVRFIAKMVVGRGSGLPRQSARRLAGFLFLRITLVNLFMELLIAVPVIAGAGLLGSFLGKAFVAIIQKFSND